MPVYLRVRRLPTALLVLLLGVLLAPSAASGAANPGQVELNGTLSYTARAGDANDIAVEIGPEMIVVRDSVPLRAALGCRGTADPQEVRCTRDDAASSSGYSWSSYAIDAGDGNDRVQVSIETSAQDRGYVSGGGAITGGAGNDELIGSDGSDTLIGGAGADKLRGGGGDFDTVTYPGHAAGVNVTIGAGADDGSTGELDDVGADVENVAGTDFDDVLVGDGGRNQLYGGAGSDELDGGGGDDYLGAASSYYGTGYGYPGPDPAAPADGDDAISGGEGSDYLSGGPGADTFDGGEGQDTADFGDHGMPVYVPGPNPPGPGPSVTITIGDGANDGVAGERDDVQATIENVNGGYGDDTITGDDKSNRLDGGGGVDTVYGGDGGDTLAGGSDAANDVLHGEDGDDVLGGGWGYGSPGPGGMPGGTPVVADGADTFIGGAGEHDKVDYAGRQQALTVTLDGAETGNDGQAGEHDKADVEHVTGGAADDSLSGDGGANRLHGGPSAGDDTLTGGGGNDRLTGGFGEYSSWSSDGSTQGDGQDVFSGDGGDDVISARDRAIDTIACGTGTDAVGTDDGTTPPYSQTPLPQDVMPDDGSCEGVNAPRREQVEAETTDAEQDGATVVDPVETTITGGADSSILEDLVDPWLMSYDWAAVGQQVLVSTTQATEGQPPLVSIAADASLGGEDLTLLASGNDGLTPVPDCSATQTDGCLAEPPSTVGDDRVFRVRTSGDQRFILGAPTAGRVAMTTGSGSASLRYRARQGETNDVDVRFGTDSVTVTDPGKTLTVGTGCRGISADTVTCSRDETGYGVGGYAISTEDGDDEVRVSVANTSSNGSWSSSSNITGAVDGGEGDDELRGGSGQDTLVGGLGADVLRGGEGSYDTVLYGDHAEAVTVTIGSGANDGNATDGLLVPGDDVGSDVENVSGTIGDDDITGDAGANNLYGGGGSDTLDGGAGNDWLYGSSSGYGGYASNTRDWPSYAEDGADTLEGGSGTDWLQGGIGGDLFDGGAGQDTVDYGDHYDYMEGTGVTVRLADDGAADGGAADGPEGSRDTVGPSIENIQGSSGADLLVGSAKGNRLDGSGGADVLEGGAGNDAFTSGGDDETDRMLGGDGADTYDAYGRWTQQQKTEPDGADVFEGGNGPDKVDYSSRTERVVVGLDDAAGDGQAGEDDRIAADVEAVTGGRGSDRIVGNGADNRLHGGTAGDDEIDGNAGQDLLYGGFGYSYGGGSGPYVPGDGADTLRGGADQDTIHAREGAVDTVECGGAVDVAWVDVAYTPPPGFPPSNSKPDVASNCEFENPSSGGSMMLAPGETLRVGDVNGPTRTDPIGIAVTTAQGGMATAVPTKVIESEPNGVDFTIQMEITAPEQTEDDPLRVVFTVHSSLVPSGGAPALRVFRKGDGEAAPTEVDATCPVGGKASANGCIAERKTLANGDVELVVLTSHASTWNVGETVATTTKPDPDGSGTADEDGGTTGGGGTTGDTGAKKPGGGVTGPPRTGVARDTTAPKLTTTVKLSHNLAQVLRKGLVVPVSCSELCAVTAKLSLPARQAKKLKVPAVVGTGTARAGKVTLKLGAKARRAFARQRRLRLTLTLTAVDAAGNASTVTRVITLKR